MEAMNLLEELRGYLKVWETSDFNIPPCFLLVSTGNRGYQIIKKASINILRICIKFRPKTEIRSKKILDFLILWILRKSMRESIVLNFFFSDLCNVEEKYCSIPLLVGGMFVSFKNRV